MTPEKSNPPAFHPLAWKIFIAGLVVLIVGVARVNFFAPSVVPVQQVSAPAAQAREPGPMRIVVTLPPLMWAVKALAPPDAQITLLAPAGAGCEGIELSPSHVAAIERADLVIGASEADCAFMAEHHPPRRSPGVPVFLLMANEILDIESDHPWLDPSAMVQWIDALSRRLMSSNLASSKVLAEPLLAACHAVDVELRDRLAPFKGRSIITHHDAWSAVARRYGLEVAAVIQHTHDAEPSPSDLAETARIAKEKGIKAIFIEPQLNAAAAERIAQVTGARLITLDPVGGEDWPAMMRKNLDALVDGLSAN